MSENAGPHGVRGRESAEGPYESFESADGELVIYDPENRAAFVASDRWRRAPP
jgi:hypothetical protein